MSWNIRILSDLYMVMRINRFKTQRDTDFLYIGEETNSFSIDSERWMQLSGSGISNNTYFTFNSSSIYLIFTSDSEGSFAGFSVEITGISLGKNKDAEGEKEDKGPNLVENESASSSIPSKAIDFCFYLGFE